MRENIYDRVMDKTLIRLEKASDKIAHSFKGSNPFGKETVSRKGMKEAYSNLTSQDMMWLIEQHGEKMMDEFIGEMENA